MKRIVFVGLFLLYGLCAVQADDLQQEHTIQGRAQGTTYMVKYYSNKQIHQSDIDSLLNIIDVSMSLYRDSSLIKQFNKEHIMSIRMDEHMRKVVRESFAIHKLSKGYFDITVFPLIELWGFGPNGFTKVPSEGQIDSLKQIIGMDKLYIEGDMLRKTDPHVRIDLNGIAQGYSVDFLCEYLSQQGIENYIVEIGGEVRTRGQKPGEAFKIMLDETNDVDPRYSKPILVLKDLAITTSSIREKNYSVGTKTVSHHIDPRTGRPIQNKTVSVTVIAQTAMLADALDNYFMYLDPVEAISLAEKIPSVEVCVYFNADKEIKVLHSSGFNKYLYH